MDSSAAASPPAPSLAIRPVLHDTWQLYRRLFVRTTVTAVFLFGVLDLLEVTVPGLRSPSARLTMALLFVVLPVAGTALLQGALVQVVDDERNGRDAGSFATPYRHAWDRFGALLGVSLLTGLGVGVGALFLIVPGIVLFTRWSLAVPVVMLEGLGPRAAMRRSRELVRGHFWGVLTVLVNAAVRTGIAALVLRFAFVALLGDDHSTTAAWLGATLATALSTPYMAHALSVVYYRLTDPERPVIAAEPEQRWTTIWNERAGDSEA
jgi:hypothetical protein